MKTLFYYTAPVINKQMSTKPRIILPEIATDERVKDAADIIVAKNEVTIITVADFLDNETIAQLSQRLCTKKKFTDVTEEAATVLIKESPPRHMEAAVLVMRASIKFIKQ